jgi:predicted dehydrogenase
MEPIRVGVVGASAGAGWARSSHVPALHAVEGLELAAVATSRAETAEASAREHGARHGFADATALVRHPDVDLVVVAVKVPEHDAIVRAAIDAGKAVLCEWPLARSSAEAAALARLADDRGVRHAVGLQGSFSPAVVRARELIADGYVGRIAAVSVLAFLGAGTGAGYAERSRYRFDPANGATLLAIGGGHTLHTVASMVGETGELSARLQVQYPRVRFTDSGDEIDVVTPDQVLLHGRLRGGAAFSMHLQAEKRAGVRTLIEIAGSEGDLRLASSEAEGRPGVQLQRLALFGARRGDPGFAELPLAASGLEQPALNVASLYEQLAADLRQGTFGVPSFGDAVRLHRLLDAVAESAAEDGRSVAV